MSRRVPRVFGTTEPCIARAEAALGRAFPASYRAWLLDHNHGRIDGGINVFCVADDRDPSTVQASIDYEYAMWRSCLELFEAEGRHFEHLLPFADFGTGDYYCFDYEGVPSDQEPPVVHWSHETGETEPRAASFRDFVAKAAAGAFEMD